MQAILYMPPQRSMVCTNLPLAQAIMGFLGP